MNFKILYRKFAGVNIFYQLGNTITQSVKIVYMGFLPIGKSVIIFLMIVEFFI